MMNVYKCCQIIRFLENTEIPSSEILREDDLL